MDARQGGGAPKRRARGAGRDQRSTGGRRPVEDQVGDHPSGRRRGLAQPSRGRWSQSCLPARVSARAPLARALGAAACGPAAERPPRRCQRGAPPGLQPSLLPRPADATPWKRNPQGFFGSLPPGFLHAVAAALTPANRACFRLACKAADAAERPAVPRLTLRPDSVPAPRRGERGAAAGRGRAAAAWVGRDCRALSHPRVVVARAVAQEIGRTRRHHGSGRLRRGAADGARRAAWGRREGGAGGRSGTRRRP